MLQDGLGFFPLASQSHSQRTYRYRIGNVLRPGPVPVFILLLQILAVCLHHRKDRFMIDVVCHGRNKQSPCLPIAVQSTMSPCPPPNPTFHTIIYHYRAPPTFTSSLVRADKKAETPKSNKRFLGLGLAFLSGVLMTTYSRCS